MGTCVSLLQRDSLVAQPWLSGAWPWACYHTVDFVCECCLFNTYTCQFSPEMRRQLSSGTTLVVDRYAFSGVAYTAAKEVCVE